MALYKEDSYCPGCVPVVKEKSSNLLIFNSLDDSSGERGIRTPGPVKINGFQDRRIRPLCHLSNTFLKWDLLPLVAYPFQKGLQRYE